MHTCPPPHEKIDRECVDCLKASFDDAMLRRIVAGETPPCFSLTRNAAMALAALVLEARKAVERAVANMIGQSVAEAIKDRVIKAPGDFDALKTLLQRCAPYILAEAKLARLNEWLLLPGQKDALCELETELRKTLNIPPDVEHDASEFFAPPGSRNMQDVVRELAGIQEGGKVVMTAETRPLIEAALAHGLVEIIPGEVRSIEPGRLNSVYRLV